MIFQTALILALFTVPLVMLFRPILTSLNLMSAYFYCTIIFSVLGVYLYAFTDVFLYQFQYLKLDYLQEDDYARAIAIIHGGLLLVLLGYGLPARISPAFVARPNLFASPQTMAMAPGRLGVKVALWGALVLTLVYMLKHQSIFISGAATTILGSLSDHLSQINLRYSVGRDFFFIVFTTCVMTYLTAYFTALRHEMTGLMRNAWILLLILTVYLHLGIFQKRPLILFLITVMLVYMVTRPGVRMTGGRILKLALIAGGVGFLVLFMLYSVMFAGIGSGFSGAQVMFISFMQVVVRLANSVLLTAHVYPEYEPFFGVSNVRMLGLLFEFDYYNKDAVLFEIFSFNTEADGTTASAAMIDFYAGFGWFGHVVLCLLLGLFLYAVEAWIRSQGHTIDRFILSVFAIWFAYYLTQANFFRAAHGYGFFYFIVVRCVLLFSIRPQGLSRSADAAKRLRPFPKRV